MDRETFDLDRRRALLLGIAGTAMLSLAGTGPVHAAEGETKELAPGVTLRTLKVVDSMIEGYPKASLSEVIFEPGSSLGPITMNNPMICEITAAPLEQHIEGQSPSTLQPGDIYTCHVGMVETDRNTGTVASIMRVFQLLPA